MAEREFFVICSNCGSEVSPYVTECPYCGTRLRKSAPDLKKQKKIEEREERKAAKKRERLRAQYEGGGSVSSGGGSGGWIHVESRPVATALLVTVSIVASILAASGLSRVSPWMFDHLVYAGEIGSDPWKYLTSPFIQGSAGYGFVCLGIFALFGAGLEKRFGFLAPLAVWVVSGAIGIGLEDLLAGVPVSFGAYACAVGAVIAWTMVVVRQEDLRDYDSIGLGAIGFVLCALPLATDSARLWPLVGGIIGGALCGLVLSRLTAKTVL